jgi:hypothetical protein
MKDALMICFSDYNLGSDKESTDSIILLTPLETQLFREPGI